MRRLLFLLCYLFFTSAALATTVEEIANLKKLNTSDELILEVIQYSPPEQAITSREIIYLKERGVTDRVLSYLIRLNRMRNPAAVTQIGNTLRTMPHARVYSTLNEKGKKVTVLTNLDEQGKRIGPPPPPPSPEPAISYSPAAGDSREFHVYVHQNSSNGTSYDDSTRIRHDDYSYDAFYYPYYYSMFSPYGFFPFRSSFRKPFHSKFGFHRFDRFHRFHKFHRFNRFQHSFRHSPFRFHRPSFSPFHGSRFQRARFMSKR